MPECRFCGHNNPPDVELCKGCGAKVLDHQQPPAAAEPAAHPPLEEPAQRPDDFESRVLAEFQDRGKISAIKLYREATGAGLKDAKDAVEELAARHNIVARGGGGCAGLLLLLLAVGGMLAAMV